MATKRENRYSVLHWGSHPDLGNDDCFTGWDFDNLDEALKKFDEYVLDTSVQFIELDGLTDGVGDNRLRENRNFRPTSDEDWQLEWKREIAREEGMLSGVEAYNDIMGY